MAESHLRSAILGRMQLDVNMFDSPSHQQRCEADGGARLFPAQADTGATNLAEVDLEQPPGTKTSEPPTASMVPQPRAAAETSERPENVSDSFPESEVESVTPEPPPMKRPSAKNKGKGFKRPAAAAEKSPADAEMEEPAEVEEPAMKRPAGKSAAKKRPAAADEDELGSGPPAPGAADAPGPESSLKRVKAERSYTSNDGNWEVGGNLTLNSFCLISISQCKVYTGLMAFVFHPCQVFVNTRQKGGCKGQKWMQYVYHPTGAVFKSLRTAVNMGFDPATCRDPELRASD